MEENFGLFKIEAGFNPHFVYLEHTYKLILNYNISYIVEANTLHCFTPFHQRQTSNPTYPNKIAQPFKQPP